MSATLKDDDTRSVAVKGQTQNSFWGDRISGKGVNNEGNFMWASVSIPQDASLEGKTINRDLEANVVFPLKDVSGFIEQRGTFRHHQALTLSSVRGGTVYWEAWCYGQLLAFVLTTHAHLFLASIDGKELRNLGRAAMPLWSPDGGRLIISQYWSIGSDGGVWNLKADGTEASAIDTAGWSGQWSPDGRTIVYQKGRDYILYDRVDDSRRLLLGRNSALFSRVYFNPARSSDSKRVYFKAQRKDASFEICSCSVSDETDLQVHIQRSTYANIGLAFDGRIIVPFRSKTHGTVQLHAFPKSDKAPATDADAVIVQGQFTNRNSYGASMSGDQKRVYYLSVPASEDELEAKALPSKSTCVARPVLRLGSGMYVRAAATLSPIGIICRKN